MYWNTRTLSVYHKTMPKLLLPGSKSLISKKNKEKAKNYGNDHSCICIYVVKFRMFTANPYSTLCLISLIGEA